MNRERVWITLCLVLACGMVASSPGKELNNSNDRPLADEKQVVLNLEQEWVNAEIKHDAIALGRILDDKFVATFGSGKLIDKQAFIQQLVSGDVDPSESQTLTDRTVIIDNDTAIVVGTDTLSGTKKGAAYTLVARYTVTYIRRKGQWVALAEQLVRVPEAK